MGLEKIEIATCSYNLFRKEMGKPIRTSVGEPVWFVNKFMDNEFLPYFREVAPLGIFGTGISEDEYEKQYNVRLDRNKTEIFAKLKKMYFDTPLVMLCYCDVGKSWCHRTLLANWLANHGIKSQELGIPKRDIRDDQIRFF